MTHRSEETRFRTVGGFGLIASDGKLRFGVARFRNVSADTLDFEASAVRAGDEIFLPFDPTLTLGQRDQLRIAAAADVAVGGKRPGAFDGEKTDFFTKRMLTTQAANLDDDDRTFSFRVGSQFCVVLRRRRWRRFCGLHYFYSVIEIVSVRDRRWRTYPLAWPAAAAALAPGTTRATLPANEWRNRPMRVIDVQVHVYEHNHPERPWIGRMHGPDSASGPEMVAAMDKVALMRR